jgi:flagellar hook assembly protein FlgD
LANASIQFQLASSQMINLKIIDLFGRELRTLINEHRPAGYFQVYGDGKDNQGNEAGTGVYLCVFQAGGYVESRKVLVLK